MTSLSSIGPKKDPPASEGSGCTESPKKGKLSRLTNHS